MRLLIEFKGDPEQLKLNQMSHLENLSHRVFIEDFPSRPLEGEIIDLSNILEEEQLTEEQRELVDLLVFSVDMCSWNKDDKGIYLKIYCTGE